MWFGHWTPSQRQLYHGCDLSMRSGRQEATLEETHAERDCWCSPGPSSSLENRDSVTFMTVFLSALCSWIADVCFRIQRQVFTQELGILRSPYSDSSHLIGFSPPTHHASARLDYSLFWKVSATRNGNAWVAVTVASYAM